MLAVSINFRIVIFVFLLFHTNLLHLFIPNISIYLELIFSTLLLLLVFISIRPLEINFFLYVALIISVFSLLIGVYNGWYLIDIIGDSYRYVAIFFAYAVGLKVLGKLDINDVNLLIRILLFIFIISLIVTFVFLVKTVFIDQLPLFTYETRIDLSTYPILFIFLYLNFVNRPISRNNKLFFFSTIMFIVVGLVNLSKAFMIELFIYLIIPLFILKKHIINTLLILLIGIICFIGYNLLQDRLVPMFEAIYNFNNLSNRFNLDTSTSARLLEANAVIASFSNNILMLFTGYGNGALLTDLLKTDGISPSNFRDNGGLHHIHIEHLLILYRNGIIGLLFYLYWQFYIVKISMYRINDYLHINRTMSLFAVAIGSYFIVNMFIAFTNGAFYGKLINGLLAALITKIYYLNKNYE